MAPRDLLAVHLQEVARHWRSIYTGANWQPARRYRHLRRVLAVSSTPSRMPMNTTPLVSLAKNRLDALPYARGKMARLLWAAVVVGGCLVTGIATTWPLAQYLSSAIPLGTEREATVPFFNLWTLWWTADRLQHGFANYWNAPIFYPNPGTFTLSEPQPLTGLLIAPLWRIGTPLALIYNVALLTLLTLNGLFAYRLARAVEISPLAALLAGMMTVALPFVAKISGVLQLTALFGMLWTLEGLVHFGRTGQMRWAVWAGCGYLAAYLTCQQYALMFAIFALGAALVALAQQRFRIRAALYLGGVGLVAGVLVLLIAFPALTTHAQMGLSRSDEVVQALSARPLDFLTRPDYAVVPVPSIDPADTAGLFPGLILSMAAIAGSVIGLRDPRQRRWTGFLVGSTLLALLLAQGLNLSIGGWRPFATLRALVPGFDDLRSPFRFAAIMQLGLPILAGFALMRVYYRVPRGGVALVIGLALMAIIDNLSMQPTLAAIPATAQTPWTTWLRSQPDTTVVAHIPFPSETHVAAYAPETMRMIAQFDHHKALVNGYSGYFPQSVAPTGEVIPTYTQFQLAMAEAFPSYPLMCVLTKGLGVDTLVVEQAWLRDHQAQMDEQEVFLQPVYQDDEVRIYRISAPANSCQTS